MPLPLAVLGTATSALGSFGAKAVVAALPMKQRGDSTVDSVKQFIAL